MAMNPADDVQPSEQQRYAVPLVGDVLDSLTFQRYDPAPTIDGVWLEPLKKHRSENGWLMELLRLTRGLVDGLQAAGGFSLGQVSVSYSMPGRINAFHIHPRKQQNEIWTVLEGQLLVWLVDVREHSRTAGWKQRFILSGEEPARLYIPAGVAHGFRSGPHGALLCYLMDEQFDPRDPNEGRLAWDYFGRELWDEDRG